MTPPSFEQLKEMVTQDNVLDLAKHSPAVAAQMETVDINGRGLLHAAVHAKAGDALQWLLDQNSKSVDLADKQGETPLMRAAWLGYEPAVKMLLESGASLAATSIYGGTPLHFAYAGGKQAMSIPKVLIDAGADTEVCDKSGGDPGSWKSQAEARERGEALLASVNHPKRLSLPRRP